MLAICWAGCIALLAGHVWTRAHGHNAIGGPIATTAHLAATHLAVPPVPSVDAAMRLRSLNIRRLGRARTLLHTDRDAGLAEVQWLHAHARTPWLRDATLLLLVDDATSNWPDDYRGRFLSSLVPAVLRAARDHRVPPSVTLAQAVLESGWGRSGLARRHNNLFGVKAGASTARVALPTREHVRGRMRPRRETFRTYPHPGASITHHAQLLGTDRRYARARELWTDWPAFLDSIAPRYASHPNYANKVGIIIRRYDLDRWDAMITTATRVDDRESDALDGQAALTLPTSEQDTGVPPSDG